eukprot:6162453-Lingulodinium_polyedra.AAC.1
MFLGRKAPRVDGLCRCRRRRFPEDYAAARAEVFLLILGYAWLVDVVRFRAAAHIGNVLSAAR